MGVLPAPCVTECSAQVSTNLNLAANLVLENPGFYLAFVLEKNVWY